MIMTKQLMTIFFVLSTGLATTSPAATWYIKADGTGDAANIQAGITASADGDTVLLAAGTYTGVGNYDIDFLGRDIVVTSESGAVATVIDCQGNGRGFVFQSAEPATSILEGLTITNGYIANRGGAVYITNASPTIRNNVMVANTADNAGGGMYVRQSASIIENNTITENFGLNGGGIACGASGAPLVSYNLITYSTAGGGVSCTGGGANPTYTCNDIFGNTGGDALCGTDGGNNVSGDPEYCGILGSGNVYLQSDSPCAPAFSPCGILIGALPVQCGSVSNRNKTWGGMKSMFQR